MKHISILRLLAGGLIFTTASCSLDYDPVDMYSDVTEGVQKEEDKGVVFKDKAAVEAHLQTLYDQMRDRQEHWYQDMFLIGDTHSDNAYAGTRSGAPQYFESNTIPSTIAPLQRGWNRFMEDIARANKLICNIDAVTDASLTVQERESYKAQAKIFRAMIYFDMVRNWGRIPIVITEAGDITFLHRIRKRKFTGKLRKICWRLFLLHRIITRKTRHVSVSQWHVLCWRRFMLRNL